MASGTPAQAQRVYQVATGSQPGLANTRIWAPLALPVGSVIRTVSVAYQGSPIVEISRRPLFSSGMQGTAPVQDFQQTFPASPGGPSANTQVLANPVTLAADATYTVSVFCVAGASIFGVSVGYVPPTQSFVPFTGATPRALDTRNPGGTKFGVNEQRKVNLGFAEARSAVFNLTVANTEGSGGTPGGFVAAFAGDTWPGNSNVNWDHPGQIAQNLVIAALDAAGNVTLRCGINRADVIVDRIGFLI